MVDTTAISYMKSLREHSGGGQAHSVLGPEEPVQHFSGLHPRSPDCPSGLPDAYSVKHQQVVYSCADIQVDPVPGKLILKWIYSLHWQLQA